MPDVTPTGNGGDFVVGTAPGQALAGTSGNDALVASGHNTMYGGAGNDAFVISLASMDPSQALDAPVTATSAGLAPVGIGAHVQDTIYDFGGAGGYLAGNNDFLYLKGFGAGSSITFVGYGANSANPTGDTHAQYYDIHSTTTGKDYLIALGSTDGKQLILGDYNFYN